ncbi:TolC family protein [Simplicispira lacusdiani]|uniref:TolC family protein n=1 Tax=Simplicispira lacusdiani TaxID=2213010 RepID=UPI000E7121EC|nr:TolC family protein [Simplicispira lacusdiani]
MWIQLPQRRATLALAGSVIAVLSGCASISPEQSIGRVNNDVAAFAEGKLVLARSAEERQQHTETARKLLSAPLGQKEAVALALVNSQALQALLAQGWAESAEAAQSGRIANPVFGFERIVAGDELELGRALSFGLLDLLTLPARQQIASTRMELAQLRLAGEVVDHVTRVRQAWVRAVAAQQTHQYAQQVFQSAEASAELARRMQSIGNFSRLSRAREQVFFADAATRLATARHQAISSREELVRLLGLDASQAHMLLLPDRLPDLPRQALDPQAVGALATQARLDIRLAQNALNAAGKAQSLTVVTSMTDIEMTVRRDTQFDSAAGARSNSRGYEIGVRLPLFDWGSMQRDAWNARTLAAASQLEATVRSAASNLRENYSAYRTALDIARHHRDEVIPLRKLISEENQLRYNGMIIGVFELLADARDQINTVMATISAEQQFWLAEAALQASLIGRPTNASLSAVSPVPGSDGEAH